MLLYNCKCVLQLPSNANASCCGSWMPRLIYELSLETYPLHWALLSQSSWSASGPVCRINVSA